ncbi:ferric reductase-like transmembrane domain-containing protein [Sphingomonas canadensis]|uniref:Ferric reductase-like transmembrane domain-containing protein n=2 Tax=Sphingomonas canadensis TaxID=1219257 RepID=A0ABW3H4R6_9SPHN|nr:ferredoxin reductase family protein [Sphingomonas canadensis]
MAMGSSERELPAQAWPSRRGRIGARTSLILYCVAILIPAILSLSIAYQWNHVFASIVSVLNIVFMAMMLSQFALSSRGRWLYRLMGIDHAMSLHRRIGEWIAIFFFLHPFLIVLPRLWFAPELVWSDLWLSFTQTSVATGVYAWMILIVWTLVSIAKAKAGLSFEAWRYSHTIGFGVVAVLGVLHAIDVGRHGQLQPLFNWIWIAGGTAAVLAALWGLTGRARAMDARTFRLVEVRKASASDWELVLENDLRLPFAFEAGQFAWIGATRSALLRDEHPFSIASAPSELPVLRFVIRELGDFTRQLSRLKPGSRIRVDGPYGDFSLAGRSARGVLLIAGGAGIAPMLGLLRDLAPDQARLPIRLLYGNRTASQLVAQDELRALEARLPDFRQVIALEQTDAAVGAHHHGRMDPDFLKAHLPPHEEIAGCLIFVCGPPVMVEHVVAHLIRLGVPKRVIVYEEFGF